MGLFWDKLKAVFKRSKTPILEFDDPAELGFGPPVIRIDKRITWSKTKSQRANWSKWRRRG
jgi:hypothetical protein